MINSVSCRGEEPYMKSLTAALALSILTDGNVVTK